MTPRALKIFNLLAVGPKFMLIAAAGHAFNEGAFALGGPETFHRGFGWACAVLFGAATLALIFAIVVVARSKKSVVL